MSGIVEEAFCKKNFDRVGYRQKMAEREGFEPSVTCATAVFKTAALNHSTISPDVNC